ncbi:hypothetical protein HDV01_002114, partial [Terramyces sp. JEL0728]
LSFFQELASLKGVSIRVHYTGDEEEAWGGKFNYKDFFNLVIGRITAKAFEFDRQDNSGLYICGPNNFMDHIQDITSTIPSYVTHRESFEF